METLTIIKVKVTIITQEEDPVTITAKGEETKTETETTTDKININKTIDTKRTDKICMMMTRLACNRAIESSYWRMDSDSDVGLLTGYVLYRLLVELEFMDLDTFPR
jgi:hypothetical protein